MRIISGKYRGTKLFTLEGLNTRPTLDRVKEALFNILQIDLQEAVILDLFSGSGALAIESLSRGAKKAYLCDNSREAINIINKNIAKTHTEENTVVLNKSYDKALLELTKLKVKFNIVFLDPPYLSNYAEEATSKIIEYNLLEDDGIIVIETDNREKVIENLDSNITDIYDERNYGRVCLLFLKRKG
jgi:16S rRNA (guanine(966)-N(2))-methyltransferase RsmD